MEIEGSVIVVTGGASGIGRAMCERFHHLGAEAVVVDRDEEGAAEVADRVDGMAVVCDVGDADAVDDLVAAVTGRYGRIDVLCNNAGIANDGDVLTTPIDRWQQQWDVNVMAHVHAVRAVLPQMLERGTGALLHTASMAGILTSHGAAAYATTKHAVVGLAEWLSITYHNRGIEVFLLAPLGVNTPMFAGSDAEWQRMAAGPVREPEEVAVQVSDAMTEGRFLILTDPVAQEWMERKTGDLDRWLRGMRRLQDRMDELGIANAAVTDPGR